jgi:UDP:flavonoid glycosyltransferase YjiC (YdhE family)
MVSHGGFGTVIGALLHGVPMVLLPMAGDQHRNARWCAAAGAAVVLDQHSRGPLPIQKAVAKVLSDPSYRSAAGGLRDEMAGLPDISAAVAMVAQLAAERVPMTRTA